LFDATGTEHLLPQPPHEVLRRNIAESRFYICALAEMNNLIVSRVHSERNYLGLSQIGLLQLRTHAV